MTDTCNGSFSSVGIPIPGTKMLQCGDFIIMVAPNRYRKAAKAVLPNPASPDLSSAFNRDFDNDAVVQMQQEEFELPNPIGLHFDICETYIAWRCN